MDQFAQQVKSLGLQRQKSFADAIAAMRQRAAGNPQLGAKVKNTPFLVQYPGVAAASLLPLPDFFNSPQILVPANPNRIGLVLGCLFQQPTLLTVPQFEAFYSFGYPSITAPLDVVGGPPPVGQSWGFPVPGVTVLDLLEVSVSTGPLGNGTISTDAVWVTLSPAKAYLVLNLDVQPGYIIGYEQSLAIEADQRRRAA